MNKPQTVKYVAISNDGDVLIIQEPGCPVLFFARSQVPALLSIPETANALVVVDVGAAAIETVIAAKATFEATTVENESSVIVSAVLRFRLPNGLLVAYVTDEALANNCERLKALGIDLAVTDVSVNWDRTQAPLIGNIISCLPQVPPQVVGLHQFNGQHLAQLVRDALAQREKQSLNINQPSP
jgi:hypothetical protein